jgi:hypothetical protein
MRFSIFLRNELTVTTNHLLETPYELYKWREIKYVF